ncbi:la-related protein 6 isoform X2 [Venturia canescens]|uniref:la-related protein 6 isoform X2 n=1 Tax=Venturia canescens TaxID=32260 RepID=UPI001C9D1AFE|nr:la-related protein 6 isoform X2 [Venturia canescens]
MEDSEVQEGELRDEVGCLKFSPPPMKKSDTRDSISSIDSDVSLSFDRRGSKGEEADADFSDSGSSELENTESALIASMQRINSQGKLQQRHKTKNNCNNVKKSSESNATPAESAEICQNEMTHGSDKNSEIDQATPVTGENTVNRKTTDEEDDEEVPQCSEELAEKIAAQVEFYFSDENILKDAFLLKHVKRNKEGYVSLKLISSFKRVKHLNRDWRIVGNALRTKSTKLEVNEQGTKLRRRDPLPPYDQTMPSRTILAAKLPLEKLSIESVAELFSQCGEIVLIRVLRPGNPMPTEVRQAIAKRSELAGSEECALVEFTDSAAARAAMRLSLGDAQIYELQQSSNTDKKRKQVVQRQAAQHPSVPATKKTVHTTMPRENTYNSSSCASGSEAEDPRIMRNGKHPKSHTSCHHIAFAPTTGHSFRGVENTGNGVILRRLSSCSGSGSSSDTGSYSNRRFSSCSSGMENGCVPSGLYDPYMTHPGSHNGPQMYPTVGYYTPGRRFSCCSASGSVPGSPTPGYGYGYEYTNSNNFYGQTGRRGSADCGPFLRRLSSCSRDSGFFDQNNRRLSSCSSSSDSCSGSFRPRSNSSFLLMAHLPENVTRMPSGPDGTRGFGRPLPNVNSDHRSATQCASTIQSSCQ